ncbi:MAG: hypothetical protein R3C10_17925 [Pirellulales bacterium]|nr:hypothetical protein [Planctomycetales bacterium]
MKTSWLLILMAVLGTFTLGCGEKKTSTPAPAAPADGGGDAAPADAPAE